MLKIINWRADAVKKSRTARKCPEPLRTYMLTVLAHHPHAKGVGKNRTTFIYANDPVEKPCPHCGQIIEVATNRDNNMLLGKGNTPEAAWKDAFDRIINRPLESAPIYEE